jgi:hypothetical protein
MPEPGSEHRVDLQFLHDASASLLGYFVHTWYRQYLAVILGGLRRLVVNQWVDDLVTPTEQGRYVLFDFDSLNIGKLSYIVGIYFYILSCHKYANRRLMTRYDGQQVMYLRGYDYEGSLSTGGDLAMGFSSTDTFRFGATLRDLLGSDASIFKVLSPKDVYWETVDAQRYFYGDYDGMIRLIGQRPSSVFLNARGWQEGVADLLDRMDHYVVYVSSVTQSLIWELEQLDTDGRRERVTVVFDEKAIANKDLQMALQRWAGDEYGERLIWSKRDPPPLLTPDELRDWLSARFLVTTPDGFEAEIDHHRARIAESRSHLAPGVRERWIDFRFEPAIDQAALDEIRSFLADLQARVEAATRDGIECLPLFLTHVQLVIYTTLLLGAHDQTGRALASYAGVMRGALGHYEPEGESVGALSPQNRDSLLARLQDHLEMAEYTGVRLLAYGQSHEFDDFSATATVTWEAIFDATTAAVVAVLDRRTTTATAGMSLLSRAPADETTPARDNREDKRT